MPSSSLFYTDPPPPNVEEQDEHLNNATALAQMPCMARLPAPPTQPRATASTKPSSSPSQPFASGNLPCIFRGLRNSSQHNPHPLLPGVPLPRGSINQANAISGLHGGVREYRGIRFFNRTGAPPLNRAPANLGVYIENAAPGSNRAVNAIPYRATPNTNTSRPLPYISFARMPAPGFNYPKTLIHVMRPNGTRTGQFSMQFDNAVKEAEGLEFVRPWLERRGPLYPEDWGWQAVCGNRRVAMLDRENHAAVEELLR